MTLNSVFKKIGHLPIWGLPALAIFKKYKHARLTECNARFKI